MTKEDPIQIVGEDRLSEQDASLATPTLDSLGEIPRTRDGRIIATISNIPFRQAVYGLETADSETARGRVPRAPTEPRRRRTGKGRNRG